MITFLLSFCLNWSRISIRRFVYRRICIEHDNPEIDYSNKYSDSNRALQGTIHVRWKRRIYDHPIPHSISNVCRVRFDWFDPPPPLKSICNMWMAPKQCSQVGIASDSWNNGFSVKGLEYKNLKKNTKQFLVLNLVEKWKKRKRLVQLKCVNNFYFVIEFVICILLSSLNYMQADALHPTDNFN